MARAEFGRWIRGAPLGTFGQSFTYMAKDSTNEYEGDYVLKRLRDPNRAEWFRREVKVLSAIDHPNVIKVVDYQLDEEPLYLVSEYCRRGDLERVPVEERMQPEIAFSLFENVCAGLAVAHARNVVHRDVKPANILLADDGHAVVADFGICYVPDEARLTGTHDVMAPRWFGAPELRSGWAKPEHVTPRCNVYSLGKLLFWLLSGGEVFERERPYRDDPELNLVTRRKDWRMEHVNGLLDRMIVEDPAPRLPDADSVAVEAANTFRLLQGNYNVVARDNPVPMRCLFCGFGQYDDLGVRSYDVLKTNFAQPIPDWRVLACNRCGNVQVFAVHWGSAKDLHPPAR